MRIAHNASPAGSFPSYHRALPIVWAFIGGYDESCLARGCIPTVSSPAAAAAVAGCPKVYEANDRLEPAVFGRK